MIKIKSRFWVILIALTVTIIPFLLLFNRAVDAEKEIILPPAVTIERPTEKLIEPIKAGEIPQLLLDIGWAESHSDQNKVGLNYRYKTVKNEDGTTTKVKYLWSKDIGTYQINDFYNKESCAKSGFDIYTEEGNAGCALLMYNTLGTTPWEASKYCWSDIVACKAKRGGAYYK